jgi:cytidyltransferase-like protein
MTVLTFRTFDLLNIGHLSFLNRVKEYGNKLVVGVASDEIVNRKNI